MEEVVVVSFGAEGESSSVHARLTPEGWRYRWVYSSIWDDFDAESFGIVSHSESEEFATLAETLPERWYAMSRPTVHANWAAWFQEALTQIVVGITDITEKRRVKARWREALERSGDPRIPGRREDR
jgi:hypothetical protein